ncbi:aminotransferase class V-fold PLP-dependent enzyme, partial [Allorhizocola rhizosphaerae]|uniref:aminotransferase class V-fold PLP-dependent enzyme n=1 Tax=Allorhizocola rhizosphaerae TaxID=1872709 RepID=UPI0013C2A25C
GGGTEYGKFFQARERARRAAARLLEAHEDEMALVSNTSEGLQLVAGGLRWAPGDEVVVFERDFPANVQPWRRLAELGVRCRFVPMRDGGGYDLSDLAAAIGPATRLIAVSQVNFLTGFRIDLDAVCALAREADALVCVDAVQSLGALELSVARTPVDFVAAGCHKWLCGPPGTGVLYCRRERLDLLARAPLGWFGYDRSQDVLVRGEAGHFTYDLPPRPSARRFEGGMPNMLGFVGLAEALEEIESVGVPAIAERVSSLTRALREGLRERGHTVLGPDGDAARSGIVTFAHVRAKEIYDRLTTAGFALSFPDGRLRLSPHYWTSMDEIAACLVEIS